jgi:hypothetical protein
MVLCTVKFEVIQGADEAAITPGMALKHWRFTAEITQKRFKISTGPSGGNSQKLTEEEVRVGSNTSLDPGNEIILNTPLTALIKN